MHNGKDNDYGLYLRRVWLVVKYSLLYCSLGLKGCHDAYILLLHVCLFQENDKEGYGSTGPYGEPMVHYLMKKPVRVVQGNPMHTKEGKGDKRQFSDTGGHNGDCMLGQTPPGARARWRFRPSLPRTGAISEGGRASRRRYSSSAASPKDPG